jgi:hypothetical protein
MQPTAYIHALARFVMLGRNLLSRYEGNGNLLVTFIKHIQSQETKSGSRAPKKFEVFFTNDSIQSK